MISNYNKQIFQLIFLFQSFMFNQAFRYKRQLIAKDLYFQKYSKRSNFIKHQSPCQNRQILQMSKSKVTKKARRNIYKSNTEQIKPDSISSSFASNAKKQLRQISHQNEVSYLKEWHIDQDQSLVPLSQLTNKDINLSKFSLTRGNFKLASKKLDHSLQRRIKTMASDDSQSSLSKLCNPVEISFYQSIKRERQSRIHSRRMDNLDCFASDKTSKTANIFKIVQGKNCKAQTSWKEKRSEEKVEKKKSSIVYLPKASLISRFRIKNSEIISEINGKSRPLQLNKLQRKKQFLFLTNILQKERQNIFYPTKAYRCLKIQDKPTSSTTFNKF